MDLRERLTSELREFASAYSGARSVKTRTDFIKEATDRILALIAETKIGDGELPYSDLPFFKEAINQTGSFPQLTINSLVDFSGPVMPETPSEAAYDAICELIEFPEKHESLQLYTAVRAALLEEQKERSNSNERYDHADDALHLMSK